MVSSKSFKWQLKSDLNSEQAQSGKVWLCEVAAFIELTPSSQPSPAFPGIEGAFQVKCVCSKPVLGDFLLSLSTLQFILLSFQQIGIAWKLQAMNFHLAPTDKGCGV